MRLETFLKFDLKFEFNLKVKTKPKSIWSELAAETEGFFTLRNVVNDHRNLFEICDLLSENQPIASSHFRFYQVNIP